MLQPTSFGNQWSISLPVYVFVPSLIPSQVPSEAFSSLQLNLSERQRSQELLIPRQADIPGEESCGMSSTPAALPPAPGQGHMKAQPQNLLPGAGNQASAMTCLELFANLPCHNSSGQIGFGNFPTILCVSELCRLIRGCRKAFPSGCLQFHWRSPPSLRPRRNYIQYVSDSNYYHLLLLIDLAPVSNMKLK